jgi:hypothetical protein
LLSVSGWVGLSGLLCQKTKTKNKKPHKNTKTKTKKKKTQQQTTLFHTFLSVIKF